MKSISKVIVFGFGLLLLALVWMTTADVANADFTGCRDSGDSTLSASIFILDGSLQNHDQNPPQVPPYVPAIGDQVAVFTTRPALDPPVCAGMIVWAGDGVVNQFVVWEQDGADPGMLEGEEMELRIWDSTNDRIFVLNNIQWSAFGDPGPNYTRDGNYGMDSATPTAVFLTSLTASSTNGTWLVLILLAMVGMVVLLLTIRRRLAA